MSAIAPPRTPDRLVKVPIVTCVAARASGAQACHAFRASARSGCRRRRRFPAVGAHQVSVVDPLPLRPAEAQHLVKALQRVGRARFQQPLPKHCGGCHPQLVDAPLARALAVRIADARPLLPPALQLLQELQPRRRRGVLRVRF